MIALFYIRPSTPIDSEGHTNADTPAADDTVDVPVASGRPEPSMTDVFSPAPRPVNAADWTVTVL
jgi:hypothetical protein